MAVVAFWVLGPLAVVSGLQVFRLGSMARATISLLVSFLAAAGLLIVLGLSYLGVVIILMMVMEMVIMATFMIAYMMNPAGLVPMSMVHNKRWAIVLSLATFVLLGAGILATPWPHHAPPLRGNPTLQVGMALMGSQMLTMVTLGFVLLATMVAAVVLATHRGRYDRFGDDLKQRPPADPLPGGFGR